VTSFLRRTRTWLALAAMAAMVALAVLSGCSASPVPESAPPPPEAPPPVVLGAPDTAGLTVGSENALYNFRFKQTEPGSDRFTYRDRDLSFYFRPTPTALYFRVENLQGRPVWIDWDRSQFVDVNGRVGKVAHGTTRWRDRFVTTAQTQVPAQQLYSDYVFSMDDLVDPGSNGGTDAQPHRPILPEDQSAPTYSGRTFGVDLAFMVEDRPRSYTFRFQVASVIPR
jgi:hypothetical protein